MIEAPSGFFSNEPATVGQLAAAMLTVTLSLRQIQICLIAMRLNDADEMRENVRLLGECVDEVQQQFKELSGVDDVG